MPTGANAVSGWAPQTALDRTALWAADIVWAWLFRKVKIIYHNLGSYTSID
jgi:hypothetical protein